MQVSLGHGLNIKWHMTRQCNYNCSYCIEHDHAKTHSTVEELTKIAKELNRLTKDLNQMYRLTLIGGEVTIYTELAEILKYLDISKIKNLSIITNFFRPVDWWKDIVDLFQDKLKLSCSFHRDHVTFEDFSKKLLDFKAVYPNVKLSCSYVYQSLDDPNIEKLNTLSNQLKVYIKPDKRSKVKHTGPHMIKSSIGLVNLFDLKPWKYLLRFGPFMPCTIGKTLIIDGSRLSNCYESNAYLKKSIFELEPEELFKERKIFCTRKYCVNCISATLELPDDFISIKEN